MLNLTRVKERVPPHIHGRETNVTIMGDMILALLPLYVMAYIYYGPRSAVLGLVGAGTCLLADWLCSLISGRKINFYDLSPLVTGLILPLAMPATVPYYIIITAALFAIMIVKYPFGGTGYNLFNPAAAGFAFAVFCWPQQMFRYPVPMQSIPIFGEITATIAESPAYVMKLGAVPDIDQLNILLGNFAGPMGATNILVMAACLLFLVIRNVVNWRIPLCYAAAVVLFVLMFPRTHLTGWQAVLYEMAAGSLTFGGIFVLNDPVTAPKRNIPKAIYGAVAGTVTMIFRYYGGFEQGVMFAVLLVNAFAPLTDRVYETIIFHVRRIRFAAENSENKPAKQTRNSQA